MATRILIASTVLGSDTASITFSSIPQVGYDDLLLVCSIRTTRGVQTDDDVYAKFNTVTTSRTVRLLYGNGATAASNSGSIPYIGTVPGAGATANTFGAIEVLIPNYAGSTNKSYSATSVHETNGTTAYLFATAGLWSSTAAITAIELYSINSANLVTASSAYLYGLKH